MDILISTIISSSAALVAIIGGFLVSRVITLSSEKSAIQKKVREVDNELITKNELLESAKHAVEEEDVDDFFYDHTEDIILNQKSIDNILTENPDIILSRDMLDTIAKRILAIVNHLEEKFIEGGEKYRPPDDFNEFVQKRGLNTDKNRDWIKHIYGILLRNYYPRQRDLADYLLVPVTTPFKQISSQREYQEKVRKVEELKDNITVLCALKEAEMDILNSFGKISGLWSGLAVLIYACVVGIIIPSFFLPYPLEQCNDPALRMLFLLLFTSELFALFIYLGVSMRELTKEKNRW